jgi:uncharacterized membrane protein (Fun14 family)
MKEFMYDINTLAIAGILFVSMAVAIEAGYRLGRQPRVAADDSFKAHVNGIAASLVGILALLLGFTFSLSLQRFDQRSGAVVDEANAIGTAYLRSQLLPAPFRGDVQKSLRSYVALRVQASSVTLASEAERERLLAQAKQTQRALWAYALQAAEQNPNPVTSGLFIQALNELIDSLSRREAALTRHVPEVVLLLLYGTFLMAGAIVGYAAGVAGHRASFVTYIMVALIVVLVFVILDLDRPRRGLIEVSQESLRDLQAAIDADTNPAIDQPTAAEAGRSAGTNRR